MITKIEFYEILHQLTIHGNPVFEVLIGQRVKSGALIGHQGVSING
jgi:hypothetical protein